MKQINFLTRLIFLLLFVACNSNKNSDLTRITRESFKTNINLENPEEIIIDSLLNPTAFYILYDTIIVAQNQPNCDYLLELYSFRSLEPITKIIKKGNGPYEMTSCISFIHSSTDPDFLLQDRNKNIYYIVNLDSMLNLHRLYYTKKINMSTDIHPDYDIVSLDGSNYFGYNMWYLNNKEYTNSDQSIIKNSLKDNNLKQQYVNFVASVNGAFLIPLKEKKQLMVADAHLDNIQIVNDSLEIVKEIVGPDFFSPSYMAVQNDSPEKFILFASNKFFKTYTNYTMTHEFIYLIYDGTTSFDPLNLTPVEVFKFDFNGNPICRYTLDRYIYTISIDSKNEYLYGTSRQSAQELPVLIRYKL